MPFDQLRNPFDRRPPGNPDTGEFLSIVLGRKIEGVSSRKAEKNGLPPAGAELKLTPEQLAAMHEAKERRETRKRIIDWVEEFSLDQGQGAEEWVDENFKFLPSGQAECMGDLFADAATYFPKGISRVDGNLYLDGLTSAQGLKLPESMNGDLSLISLTSAQGLKLPESVNGHLWLNSLTSAQGLKLPREVRGIVFVSALPMSEVLKLREKYPGLRIEIWQ
jgi:hypothetical protein